MGGPRLCKACNRVLYRPCPMNVGTRVEVAGHGKGTIAMDNEDGTWNVEFDDDREGDFPEQDLCICTEQSLDALKKPVDVQSSPSMVMTSGIRIVNNPEKEPKPAGWTRFVCFSDTHGHHDRIPPQNRPSADVLLHAGDLTNTGEPEQIESLSKWLEAYPAAHKVVIAGNHDITFHEEYYTERGAPRFHRRVTATGSIEVAPYDCATTKALLKGCHYLEDAAIEVCGYTIYGSPWQPEFCDWAFNLPRGEPLRDRWAQIPESVDVLLTHSPPKGYCDENTKAFRAGCEELLAAIQKRTVSVNVFGHIHEGYGCGTDGVTLFANASTCTHAYKPTNRPIVFDLPPPEELRASTRLAAEQVRTKASATTASAGYH